MPPVAHDHGPENRPLPEESDVLKSVRQEVLEFILGQFADMMRVGWSAKTGISIAVRRTDECEAVGTKNALDLSQEFFLIIKMLNRFKGDNAINAFRLEGDVFRFSRPILQVIRMIVIFGVLDRLFINLNANDRTRHLGKQRGTVAFARCDIENIQPTT